MGQTSEITILALTLILTFFALASTCTAEEETPSSHVFDDLVSQATQAEKRGYLARPCGFDMNRNGILGESADSRVGNGNTSDPDEDGVDEDMLYVDSEKGHDVKGDGSAQYPYRTIQKALDVADGPGDGSEDIICISGVFNEELTLTQSGVAGHYIRDGFQFPKNPFMIIGWDKDGDGMYPPYDPDDTAVLDGKGMLDMAITNLPNKVSRVEIAHLTIRNFGNIESRNDRGAIRFSGVGHGRQSHIYVHDVEIKHVTVGHPGTSNTVIANFWSKQNTLTHISLLNLLVDGVETWFARGAPGNGSGHFRFQNITLKLYGKSSNTRRGWKMWNAHSQVEILDSIIDGTCPDPNKWNDSAFSWGMRPSQCAHDWTIRGNVFLNLDTAIGLKGYAGEPEWDPCQFRSLNRITIDRNIILTNRKPRRTEAHPKGIEILGDGPSARATVENVAITNNFMAAVSEWTPIHSMAGNSGGPQPGTITIAGNQIIGPFHKSGLCISQNDTRYPKQGTKRIQFPQNNYVIQKNVFDSAGRNKININVDYSPTGWVANGNSYDGNSGFIWNNKPVSNFANWQKVTGQDLDSKSKHTQLNENN